MGLGVHEERVAKDGEAVFIAVDVRGKMRGGWEKCRGMKKQKSQRREVRIGRYESLLMGVADGVSNSGQN